MAEETKTNSGQRRAVTTIIFVSIIIVALSALAGWFIFFNGGDDAEEREAYEQIIRYQQEGDFMMMQEALNEYFDTYTPDASHYSLLKELADKSASEQTDWKSAESAGTADAIRNFLTTHPDGFYRQIANEKFDSLAFAEASKLGTRDAITRYMEQCPQGKFIAQAQEMLGKMDKQLLTEEEKQMAKDVIDKHFNAMANNDRTGIASTLASTISSYIGKADPELEDIFNYMSRIHPEGRVLVLYVQDPQVSKVESAGHYIYNVKFTLEEETYSSSYNQIDTDDATESEEEEPINTKTFSGVAVLNDNMKITTLVLKQ